MQDSDTSGSEETLPKGGLVSCPGGLRSGDETKLDAEVTAVNPDEIVLSDSSDSSDLGTAGGAEVGAGTRTHAAVCLPNPDEIALSDSEDDSVDRPLTSGLSGGSLAPTRGRGATEKTVEERDSESVLTAAGSSAEKDSAVSVMLQEQPQSDGSGDSRGSSALGRKPLLLPHPAHPGSSSSATGPGGPGTGQPGGPGTGQAGGPGTGQPGGPGTGQPGGPGTGQPGGPGTGQGRDRDDQEELTTFSSGKGIYQVWLVG